VAIEILPTGSDGQATDTERVWTIERGVGTTKRMSGTKAAMDALFDAYAAQAEFNPTIAGLSVTDSRGRATLTITYAKVMAASVAPDDQGLQELIGVDAVRSIFLAPYFVTTAPALAVADIMAVRKAYEDGRAANAAWNQKQKRLYGHLCCGIEQYAETAYVFRQTFRTSGAKIIRKAAADANTVQALPNMSSKLKRQIDALPAGEWLKKPTEVKYLGREGTDIVLQYQWAPKWSIVYGGTFTGD